MTVRQKAKQLAKTLLGEDQNIKPIIEVLMEMAAWQREQCKIKQPGHPFGYSPRIETTEEGVIYCDGITCTAWMNYSSKCDNCPILSQKQ